MSHAFGLQGLEAYLTDERIAFLFDGTNFGDDGKTCQRRKQIMAECILKLTAGYADGHTIKSICACAALLTVNGNPTKAAKQWAVRYVLKMIASADIDRLLEIALDGCSAELQDAKLAAGKPPVLPRHRDLIDRLEQDLAFVHAFREKWT